MEKTILWNQLQVPLLGTWDVVIIGGGAAGSSAGITCAGNGLRTLIIDKNNSLGGTGTNALVTPMMQSWTGHHSNFFLIERKLNELGYLTRDELFGDYLWYSAEGLSFALESLYTQRNGQLLYDTAVCGCMVSDGQLRYVICSGIQGLCAVEGRCFLDASGDAVLARYAGVPVSCGDDNGNNQMTSLRFEIGGIDVERYRAYVSGLGDTFSVLDHGYFYESAMVGGRGFALEPVFRQAVEDGVLLPEDLRYYQNFSIPGKPGCMSFNCPHLAELTRNTGALDRSAATVSGHKMIRRLAAFLKSYVPGFENSFLLREANMLGVRESYRIIGKYVMTEEDFASRTRFEDGIARGDWYIDVHSATKGLFHMKSYEKGEFYEIPYRAMICEDISNLVVAGRCISTTFLMQASIRIIPTCIDMGQAAGEACTVSCESGNALNTLSGADIRGRMDYKFHVNER